MTNSSNIASSINAKSSVKIDDGLVTRYLNQLEDAFLISKAKRYDVKGKRYINSPLKYYFEDIGLRNARLNFRQTEESHVMENIIYNELKLRGYNVDVGIVEVYETDKKGKRTLKKYEVDFIATQGDNKYYIQSALEMNNEEKAKQERKSLVNINDSFKKIIVVKDDVKPRKDDNGITTIGIFNFLLEENSLDL